MEVFGGEFTISLKKDTDYHVQMSDISAGFQGVDDSGDIVTSNSKGGLVVTVPNSEYDGWFALSVREIDASGPLVLMDTITRGRRYVEVDKILEYMRGKVTPLEAGEYESVARGVINDIVGYGFGFTRYRGDVVGNGTDFLPLNSRLHSVFRLFENSRLIWDVDPVWLASNDPGYAPRPVSNGYSLSVETADRSTNLAKFPITWSTRFDTPFFQENVDFGVDGEWGWPVVPEDIQRATLLLINDIACGNGKYQNKYIKSFSNGVNAINYSNTSFFSTGNMIVDRIISKYSLESIGTRVL
jgi:hypothetical protein